MLRSCNAASSSHACARRSTRLVQRSTVCTAHSGSWSARGRTVLQQDPRLQPLLEFWQHCVGLLQPLLSDSFAPALVFFGPAELLPSGAPGDPARDFTRSAARACGVQPQAGGSFAQPYALCPEQPGGLPASDSARDCCRHFAYAVPRSRYAFAAIDRQASCVASPRLALAAPATWQGVLVHELGHCIDFETYGQRYRAPPGPPPASETAAAALAVIDANETDAEIRADLMANALLGQLLGRRLCYAAATRVQELVPEGTLCSSAADVLVPGSSVAYLEHFPHPPLAG